MSPFDPDDDSDTNSADTIRWLLIEFAEARGQELVLEKVQ